jgi:hypothetical protein
VPNESLRDRIEGQIERDPVFGCHLWTGRTDRDGYGTLWSPLAGARQAHRAVYLELVGPVEAGLVLDHLCRRRRCVRPAHLEPVTGAENDLRRSWAHRARRATCPRGHTLSTALVTPEGGRLCRTCQGPEVSRAFDLPIFDEPPLPRELDKPIEVRTPVPAPTAVQFLHAEDAAAFERPTGPRPPSVFGTRGRR